MKAIIFMLLILFINISMSSCVQDDLLSEDISNFASKNDLHSDYFPVMTSSNYSDEKFENLIEDINGYGLIIGKASWGGAGFYTHVRYRDDASNNGLDLYDRLIGPSQTLNPPVIYSTYRPGAPNYKFFVQYRYLEDLGSNESDKVGLGVSIIEDDYYTISLGITHGIFKQNQGIYLFDKDTETTTNLRLNAYTFYSDAVTHDENRFVIYYEYNP